MTLWFDINCKLRALGTTQDRVHSLCPWWPLGSDLGGQGHACDVCQGGHPRRSERRWKGIRKQDHDCVCDWESFSNARGFVGSFFSPWSNWEYIVMSQVFRRWSHSSSHIPVASCATFVSDALSFVYSTFGSPLQQITVVDSSSWPQLGRWYTLLKYSKH